MAEETASNEERQIRTRTGIFLPFGLSLQQVERTYIMRTLAKSGYNKSQAARTLGISRKTLYEKLNRWEDSGAHPH